ncbi:Na(+)/H(+) antiporter subunit B [Natribacillus halophilus]|uniref:Multisubunit sodium/proton antiporter, MrpB subunit n=1 Tax=Natribacillus halophilus TaxID=549003 RepID=A0A1G8QFS3_9BACI|nr:Na(+)/H(+) antiporter subunit B [Natribacillus halophilus]SDJ03433.1 multisubunit sodium/proton antiporter, MrpB subunit [Natribacillus halophilus]
MKTNDVILQTIASVAAFIILAFAAYLFFAGHHEPGGGFIGGLVIASALVLLYIAFDMETVEKGIPVDYKILTGIGIGLSLLTGVGAMVLGYPFLSHTYEYVDFPFFGEIELATSLLFEAGVSLAVVGAILTIILSISEDV